MNLADDMLKTLPEAAHVPDLRRWTTCIEACLDCVQACNSCAIGCLGEKSVRDLVACIRACMDVADLAMATAGTLSRLGGDPAVARAAAEACRVACSTCAEQCASHAEMHEHCRLCAEVCRRCEQACAELVRLLEA